MYTDTSSPQEITEERNWSFPLPLHFLKKTVMVGVREACLHPVIKNDCALHRALIEFDLGKCEKVLLPEKQQK